MWIWRKIKYSILILIQTCHSYWLHPSYKICERLHKLTSKCKKKLTLSPFSNGFNQLNITPLFSQSLSETKRKSVYIIVNKIWKNDNKQWKLQIRIERKILWNWNCNFILYQLFYISQPTNEHILNIYTKECLQLLRMKRIDLYSYYVYETIVLNLRYYMDNIINYWLITLCCMWQRQSVNPHRYNKVKTSASKS